MSLDYAIVVLAENSIGRTGHRVAVVSKVEAEEFGRSSGPKLTPVTLSPLTFTDSKLLFQAASCLKPSSVRAHARE